MSPDGPLGAGALTSDAGAASERPGVAARWLARIDPLAFVLPLGILVAWSGVYLFELMPRVLMPSPWDVVTTIAEWMNADWARGRPAYFSGSWASDALGSSYRALVGFVMGATLAIVLGIWVGWSRQAERVLDPTVQLLRPMPRTALLPFAIIFFGLTDASALFLVTYGVFLQVYVQVVTGVKFVGRDWKRAALMLGASPRQVLWRVVLPGAMPHIFSGLRLGIAYSWTLMILAEMFAVSAGFGYVLWRGYEFMRMDIVLAGMLMLGIFGFISDRVIVVIGRRKLAWAQEISGTRL